MTHITLLEQQKIGFQKLVSWTGNKIGKSFNHHGLPKVLFPTCCASGFYFYFQLFLDKHMVLIYESNHKTLENMVATKFADFFEK